MESTQVVIVGGGIAGLSAAKTLGDGVNYILVEAQNYLGGRIYNVDPVPNLTVDLGAQYIHGNKDNSVFDLCTELDMLMPRPDNSEDDVVAVTTDGNTIDPEVIEKATELWEQARHAAEEKYNDSSATPVAFADFVPKVFEQLLSDASVSGDLIQPLVKYFMKFEMTETACSSLSDLNLIEYVAYDNLKGNYESDLKNGGYRPFVNHFKSFIPDDRVRLNSEVTHVKFNGDDSKLLVTVNSLTDNRKKTIVCDHIIWTTSLGYLKDNFNKIFMDEPELIQQKQNAIANMGFGTVDKVFMIYDKKFWSENIKRMVVLRKDNTQSFKMSDSLRQKSSAENIPNNLFQEVANSIFHYDVLPSTDIPVLICWFAGDSAEKVETFSDQLAGQLCHEVLCNYMNVPHDQYKPIRFVKSGWRKNKYIRGSYTYHSINSTSQDGEQLREPYAPDGVQRILFAGEATHPGYYSTINAALETGAKASETVLSIIE